jgi:hypothetical protein
MEMSAQAPAPVIRQHVAAFAGTKDNPMDSAIDVLMAAKNVRNPAFVYIQLAPGTDSLKLIQNGSTDFCEYASSNVGLVLTAGANCPESVIIDGGGRTVKLAQRTAPGSAETAILTVGAGVSLTLRNITFAGGDNITWALLIRVNSGGRLILEDGAVIRDNLVKTNNSTYGTVYVNGGTFTMNGGTISGNYSGTQGSGGGVHVRNGGTFIMNGGTISGNRASQGGGVYLAGEGNNVFHMYGGEIVDNVATNTATMGGGGGVFIDASMGNSFFMSDSATISRNEATRGGGVFVYRGTFSMTGGIISCNQAANRGGGVFIFYDNSNASFSKTGNSVIYGLDGGADANIAPTAGPAVCVTNSSPPGKVRNNTATEAIELNSPDPANTNWE